MPNETKRNSYTFIDGQIFKEIYENYFLRLLRFALEYVKLKEDAENIVQDVFQTLWESRHELQILLNLQGYMFTLTKNRCIDFLRRKANAEKGKKILQDTYEQELRMKIYSLEALNPSFITDSNREQLIAHAIDSLPEKCRKIFFLHKIDGKKYREIAEEMNISVNTVENHMANALRKLREELKSLI